MTDNTSEFGYFKDGKLYLKGFLNYPDRAIGEVRTDEATTMQYYIRRFDIALRKVGELEKSVEEAENKGSYLMKLLHLREYLQKFDGLGDYIPLFDKLDELEKGLREMIAVNRDKNLEIKRALLVEGKEAISMPNFREATEKFNEIKENWIKTGNVLPEYRDEVEGGFQKLFEDFKARQTKIKEDKARKMRLITNQYEAVIRDAEYISRGRITAQSVAEFRKLTSAWRNLPPLPPKVGMRYQKNFKFISKKIFDRYNQVTNRTRPEGDGGSYSSSRPQSAYPPREQRVPRENSYQSQGQDNPEENLLRKKRILEQMKTLMDIGIDLDQIKEIKNQWKAIGKVPPYMHRALNEEFFLISDYLMERIFLEQTAENRTRDYARKNEIEKSEIKYQILKNIMDRDEKDLENFNGIQNDPRKTNRPPDPEELKLLTKSRKLKAKKKLLEELRSSIRK